MSYWQMIGVACVATMLSACVTTMESSRPVNIEGAHEKRIELGMSYLQMGQRDNARWQFNRALELKRNSPQAYHGFALVHQANGEMEPAETNFRRALRLARGGELSPIYVSYGSYLMAMGRDKDACDYFERAAADFDFHSRPEALFMAGQCAQRTGNQPRVKSAYEHALNLNPNFVPAVVEMADIYFNEGDYARAKRLLDRLETLASPTARSLWLGIRIERIFGNKDKEASYALALRNLFPYSNELLEYRRLTETRSP